MEEAIPMNIETASIPEFVAYHIIGGTLVDLRHADRMLDDIERQASDPIRAATFGRSVRRWSNCDKSQGLNSRRRKSRE